MRLIDANIIPYHKSGFPKGDGCDNDLDWAFREDIDKLPTVDAAPVVHGRWIPIIDEPTPLRTVAILSMYQCSVCGRFEEKEEPYCNCGAKMDGGVDQ